MHDERRPRVVARAGSAAALFWVAGCTGAVIDPPGHEPIPPTGAEAPGGVPARPGSGAPSGGGGASAGGAVAPSAAQPRPLQWHRLTTEQLENTIADLFGADAPRAEVEPDAHMEGFANIGAARVATSPRGVERLDELAFAVAKHALHPQRRGRWVRCAPTAATLRACAGETLGRLGRLLFRRPVEAETLAALVALAEKAAQLAADPWAGLEAGLAAMLQSPRFYYALELPDRAAPAGGVARVDGYTVAARLALLFTNASPDEALLDAAAAGDMASAAGVRRHAERMTGGSRFKTSMRTFFASMLEIGKVRGRTFDRAVYPKGTETLGASGFEETVRFLQHHLIDGDGDYRQALFSRTTFVNRDLAAVYGVPAPAGTDLVQLTLPETANRFGLLTQVGFLAAASPPNDANTIARGRSVRQDLLCQHVPDPPADADPTLPVVPGKAASKRERLSVHRTDPGCAGCHRLLDPIGLALERYDGIGAYRTNDAGLPIDPAGDLDGVLFSDVKGFASAVQAHPGFTGCLVKKLYRFALGRMEGDAERPIIEALTATFERDGRRLAPLLLALVTHEAFSQATVAPR